MGQHLLAWGSFDFEVNLDSRDKLNSKAPILKCSASDKKKKMLLSFADSCGSPILDSAAATGAQPSIPSVSVTSLPWQLPHS